MELGSVGEKSNDRLTKELPMEYDADNKAAGYDQV